MQQLHSQKVSTAWIVVLTRRTQNVACSQRFLPWAWASNRNWPATTPTNRRWDVEGLLGASSASRDFFVFGLDTLRAGGTNPIQILNCSAGRVFCTASSPFHTWAMPTVLGTTPQKMPNGTCGQDVSCKQNGLRRPGCFMSDDSSEVYPVGIPLPVT